jgi:hypothetical protein
MTVSRFDEITLIGLSLYFVDPDEPDWTTHSSEGLELGTNVGSEAGGRLVDDSVGPDEVLWLGNELGIPVGVAAGLMFGKSEDTDDGSRLGV